MNSQQKPPITRWPQTPDPPLSRFLRRCHSAFADEKSGAVADYIPELGKANPNHFGIALATMDGHVYTVGDADEQFTIQSISKPFVFALALETLGAEKVEAAVGVEPSGEAFNSIRLGTDNRPFNPMVNAGAIACSSLLYSAQGKTVSDFVIDGLSRFAGRQLTIDDAVFESERATGDRNRAIAYLLRNYSVIQNDVDLILDVYFRQCSILVTARDIAVMAATLANGGVNPQTLDRVISPDVVARTLSVMASSGMYDFAGEWMYRVGIPAKSGVGGGIMAALPSQIGLGTFSPLVDSHGNSIRGIRICEEFSREFGLHLLNHSGDVRTCIVADYGIGQQPSRRRRQSHEQAILDAHRNDIRVLELTGALSFANMDYISRRFAFAGEPAPFVLLDLNRVPTISRAAATLLGELIADLRKREVTTVLSGIAVQSATATMLKAHLTDSVDVRSFSTLDEAIEWAEDQVIYRHGGFAEFANRVEFSLQALLAGFSPEELKVLTDLTITRGYKTGERIIVADEPASSVFFLQSGMVSVKLGNGTRLACLVPGMMFGEMALIEGIRLADVWADTPVQCLELPIDRFNDFCARYPHAGERVMRNLAVLLSQRLAQANNRVDLLSAHWPHAHEFRR